jgi:hypothetical protein
MPGPPKPGCYADISQFLCHAGHENTGRASRRQTQILNVHFGFSAEIGLIAAAQKSRTTTMEIILII